MASTTNNNATTTTTPAASKEENVSFKKEERLINFLKTFHCCSPVFPNDFNAVVRSLDTATISDCFHMMINNRIQSMPVVNAHSGKIMYSISLMDLVGIIVKEFKEEDFKKNFWHNLSNWLSNKSSKIANMPLSQFEKIADSELDAVFTTEAHDTLLDAVRLMIEKHAHRVIALDKNGTLSNVITQSRVLQFVNVMIEDLPQSSKTLKELNLGLKEVFTISESELAFTAFKKMIEKKVSALAVVNSKGQLVGNISTSDIKLLGYNFQYWELLGLPIIEYLVELVKRKDANVRSEMLTAVEKEEGPITVKVKPTDTLAFAVKWINLYRVHRAYIVDENKVPVGVLSLYDILKELVPLK